MEKRNFVGWKIPATGFTTPRLRTRLTPLSTTGVELSKIWRKLKYWGRQGVAITDDSIVGSQLFGGGHVSGSVADPGGTNRDMAPSSLAIYFGPPPTKK